MKPERLHRHQLAWLTREGWAQVRVGPWDGVAQACIAHWAEQDLPLVVTRQTGQAQDATTISMGLPAPAVFERRRLAMSIASRHVARFGEFPYADEVTDALPSSSRHAWVDLCRSIGALGAVARVHGSYGWQRVSGLPYVHQDSDIDLTFAVRDIDQADALVGLLKAGPPIDVRLDGELVFGQRHAVAWREWLLWRAGKAKVVLVKRLDGPGLARDVSDIGLAPVGKAVS